MTQFNTNVKVIQSDNGSEFISCPMQTFYGEQDILHQTSRWILLSKMQESTKNIDIFQMLLGLFNFRQTFL